MARARAKDLAGLAALGFLGYKLFGPKGEDAMGPAATTEEKKASDKRAEAQKDAVSGDRVTNKSSYTGKINAPNIGFGGGTDSDKNLKRITTTVKKPDVEAQVDKETNATSVVPGGNEKRVEGNKPMPSLKAVERKVEARKTSMSTDAMKNASRAAARRANLSPIDQIPGQNRSGPIGGERVSGSDLSRNVSNTLSALTPIGGGVGKVGAEMATAGRVQKAYNAAQTERRAAEGMSPAEAIAARKAAEQAAREAKTLNPLAYLAGPKGMAENFRRGGAIKMTASRRGDGIAQRGKTRGKMC